jgi:hypothetical protein
MQPAEAPSAPLLPVLSERRPDQRVGVALRPLDAARSAIQAQLHLVLGRRQAARPRSATILSATRQAFAMMVSVGLAPVPVGNGDPSTA